MSPVRRQLLMRPVLLIERKKGRPHLARRAILRDALRRLSVGLIHVQLDHLSLRGYRFRGRRCGQRQG